MVAVLIVCGLLLCLIVYLFGHGPWDQGEQMPAEWLADEKRGRRRDGRTG